MATEFPTEIFLWLDYLNDESLLVVDYKFIGEQYLFLFLPINCVLLKLKATVSFTIALLNCGISVCREY